MTFREITKKNVFFWCQWENFSLSATASVSIVSIGSRPPDRLGKPHLPSSPPAPDPPGHWPIPRLVSQALAEALEPHPSLTALHLTTSVGVDGAHALVGALATNTTLTSLHLHTAPGDPPARLAEYLQTCLPPRLGPRITVRLDATAFHWPPSPPSAGSDPPSPAAPPPARAHPSDWDCPAVCAWLERQGFGRFVGRFREQDVRGPQLLSASQADLVGLHVQPHVMRTTLLDAVRALQQTLECEGVGGLPGDEAGAPDRRLTAPCDRPSTRREAELTAWAEWPGRGWGWGPPNGRRRTSVGRTETAPE